MRKLLWWGAASLVAGAGAFYLAADYTCRHPNSLIGRWVTSSIPQQIHYQKAGWTTTGCKPAACPAAPADPNPVLTPPECTEPHAAVPAEFRNQVALAVEEVREPIQVDVPEKVAEAQMPATGSPHAEEAASCGEHGSNGNAEECDACFPCLPLSALEEPEDTVLMPTCGTEEKETVTTMPYVEEDPELKRDMAFPFNLWFYWLKSNHTTEGDSHEQSEMVPVLPSADAAYPEGYLPVHRSCTSDCQVDPDYPHDYSGCPHMTGGCCPYSGHCVPPASPTDTPKKKKGQKETSPRPISLHWYLKPPGKGELPLEDECTSRGALDTMECRPMDVKNAGFDPNEPF